MFKNLPSLNGKTGANTKAPGKATAQEKSP
jgi:hypothetical protein